MSSLKKITESLKKIATILRSCDESNWLPAIEKMISQLSIQRDLNEEADLIRRIIGMYGGMGSFNDLVLFDGGKVCYKENEKLDNLRKELYEQCKIFITTI